MVKYKLFTKKQDSNNYNKKWNYYNSICCWFSFSPLIIYFLFFLNIFQNFYLEISIQYCNLSKKSTNWNFVELFFFFLVYFWNVHFFFSSKSITATFFYVKEKLNINEYCKLILGRFKHFYHSFLSKFCFWMLKISIIYYLVC